MSAAKAVAQLRAREPQYPRSGSKVALMSGNCFSQNGIFECLKSASLLSHLVDDVARIRWAVIGVAESSLAVDGKALRRLHAWK